MDFLILENYKIFTSTFGVFEKSVNDVWLSWYLSSDPIVFKTLFIWCGVGSFILVYGAKWICFLLSAGSFFRSNYMSTMLYYIGFLNVYYLLVPFFTISYAIGLVGFTLYYMLGYTL